MSAQNESAQVISLDDESVSGSIVLISKEVDGQRLSLSVQKEFALLSGVIRQIIETDPEATEVPLDEITPLWLQAVVDYLNLCKGTPFPEIEKPLRSKDMFSNTVKENAQFIEDFCSKNNKDALYALIGAANYLQLEGLLHLGAAKVAAIVKGIPLDDIKKALRD